MKKLLLISMVLGLMVTPALAEPTLQEALNGITLGPIPGLSRDTITDGADAYWAITGGASASTIVMEIAGNAGVNTFGVYDMTNQAKMVQVFAGPESSGDSHQLSMLADGSIKLDNVDTGVDFAGNAFGYYVNTPDGI
ncbi:MAG: PEP-CTERM sorting domain-containing protein, partial [Sedimentisphaerales bacterium]